MFWGALAQVSGLALTAPHGGVSVQHHTHHTGFQGSQLSCAGLDKGIKLGIAPLGCPRPLQIIQPDAEGDRGTRWFLTQTVHQAKVGSG